MRILVTGANGFIGKYLCGVLSKSNSNIIGAVRFMKSQSDVDNINYISVGDISLSPNWKDRLVDCDCVIHCAGMAHISNESKKKSLEIYRLINVESTKILAEQCVSAGVKRLIFLSSIGVLGVDTNNRKPFVYFDIPKPIDNYSISKFEAEQALFKISKNSGLELVVIRSPLVYGASAPGNLARLIKFIKLGVPLPFGNLKNKRSMIGIDNLVDLIIKCIGHPDAAGKTFLVSDDDDLSTSDFINLISTSMRCKSRLFSVPIFLIKILGYISGKKKEINKLIGSLQIDINYTKEVLNWKPLLNAKEGIKRMVKSK
jgi:nucleoside-diphosphate-sugar epimerase